MLYKISFLDVDRKILRTVKALKTKSGHSITDASEILKQIHSNTPEQTKVTIVVTDMANELDYRFEDKIINPNEAHPNLMEILEEDIIASGHENAQKILGELERQFQDELAFSETVDSQEKNSRVERAPKKGSNLFGRFMKPAKTEPEKQNNPLLEDFEDLNDTEDVEVPVENDHDDFSEVPETNVAASWSAEKEDLEVKEEVPVENEFDEGQFPTMAEPEIVETDVAAEEADMVIADDFAEDEPGLESVEKTTNQLKNERVVFPTYSSFIDLSGTNSLVERHKARLESIHLINFLGLNTSGTALSDLDQIKLKYASNALNDSKFVLLRDYFHNAIGDIQNKTQTDLSQIYEEALAFDYQEEAAKMIDPDVQKIYEEAEGVFTKFQEEKDQEYNAKLEKYEFEQKKELEDFIRRQELEKASYLLNLDAKKSSSIELQKEITQKEIDSKKEKLLDHKLYDLKTQSINQLTETKRLSVRSFESHVDDAVDRTWTNIEVALRELKEDINNNVPEWKNEIAEKRKLEQEEREERRKEEQLEVEKQRIELQRQQLEMKTQEKKKDEENNFEKLMDQKLSQYDERIANQLKAMIPTAQPVQVPEAQNLPTPTGKKKKGLLALGVAGTLILGGYTGQALISNNTAVPPVAEASENKTQYDELTTKMALLEAQLTTPAAETPEETLETLLHDKNYEKAMRTFKDPESLNKIEDALYQSKDLGTLTVFNKTNDSVYGAIDEAILSKDAEKVLELYNGLSDEEKEALSADRKTSIALLLYQVGEKEIADALSGVKKDAK